MSARPAIEDILPLTPLQEGLLFHSALDADGPDVYTVQLALTLDGRLDAADMRAAAAALLQRHANLRAGFRKRRNGEMVAIVARDVALPWEEADLACHDEADRDARLDELRRAERARRFDVARPPLLRFLLVRLRPDRHTVVLTHHHVLLDGWSTPLLGRELFALYAAAGDATALAPVTPYRDYLAWLKAQDRDAARAAWGAALAGAGEPTRLAAPAVGARAPLDPSRVDLRLSANTTARLTELARSRSLTLNTIVQGAWGVLLGRLLGRDDVVFGTTVSGRPAELPGIESMIGLFINTVAVRVRLPPAEPVAAAFARLQEEQAALLPHQHLGLGEVQALAGGGELFDTLAVFESYPFDPDGVEEPAPGLRLTAVEGNDATHYPLGLTVFPGDEIELQLSHRPDCFERAEVRRIGARLVRLFEAICADPDQPLGRLGVLDRDELDELLERFNDAGAAGELAQRGDTLPDLLDEVMRRRPDAEAVVCEDETLTWTQLDARTSRLARLLMARGVGPEQTVGVALPRSVDLVVALLAVLRAGGAYLPLEPDHPDDRLAYTLADARPACVLTMRELAARLTALHPSPCLALDEPAVVDALANTDPAPVADAERAAPLRTHNAAYVIYTSGSTGRPKGVVVTHEGVSKLLATQIDRAAVTADSRVSHFASVSFDLAFWELCQAMLSGGTLVVVPSERRVPSAALTDYLRAQRITVSALPPSLLADLPAKLDLPKPLTLIVGGEAVSAALVERFAAGRMMLNCYGPTEATVQSTIGLCDPDRRDGAVPIGRPDPGVRAYVLDDGLLPAPVGVAGELYLGGTGLARGYLRRPDLSCERFVADPHGPPGARMYRTGDRARWDAGGQLHFLGRADDQLQLRGFRIEPGEIVAALASHPDIVDAAVLARRLDGDPDGGAPDQLVAFVTAPGPRPGAADLRRHLAQLLPAHMVPAAYVVLERLPALPGGKLDRRALATLALSDADLATAAGGRRPRSPREDTLCELFAEVLGVPAVGIDDDFFELGGHSLLVTRLVSRIRSALGAELTLRAVFDAPTVAQLAGRLGDRAGRAPLRAGPRPETLALSFAQQRLWFLYRLDGASATYNIPLALRLRGALDVEALRGAVADLVARHETLRTVFPERDGTPHQQILAPDEAARRGAALDPVVMRTDEAGLPDLLRTTVRHPFELDAEPPLRARLFELGPDEHVLALAVHHIAGDGWSVLPLLRDLRAAYAARRAGAGARPSWPQLPVQYADFAIWQRELMGRDDDPGSLITRDAAFWAEALADLPEELALPTDRPRPAVSSRVGGAVELTLPADLHRSLRALARGCDASVFMVLQSALAALLTRLGAGTDVPIGSPIAGRTDDALDELVGFFVNTLVLRTDTSGDPTFRALVARVREFDLSAYDHQDVPFERLVEALNPTRSLARHPVFQVMLAFQQTPQLSFDLDGLDGRPERVEAGAAKFDLAFDVLEQHGVDGLDVLVEYSTDLFDVATVRDLGERFARLLAAACAAPDVPIGRLDLLAPGEHERVVQDWGSAPLKVPAGTIPALFEQQVARTPDATALVCGDVELTFAQVDARARALAAWLAARGVGPERIVALLLPRGVDFVVCLLAVMRAGGAYLPLDPGYPPERIARTLADARPALAITTDALAPLLAPPPDPSPAPAPAADPSLAPDPPAAGPAGAPGPLALLTLDGFDWTPPTNPAPPAAARPQHPAYVIYTSGSTGEPKGVVVSHASIVNLFHSHRETLYRPTVAAAGGRALRVAHGWSFAFDASWQPQLWMPDGHALHIVSEEQLRDPALLVALLREQRIDFVEVTPSHAVALAASGLFEDGDCGLLALGVGGEAVPPSLWSEIRALPATEGYNLYGPTECTVDALAARIGDSERPLIGRPTCNARAYVLDAGLRPVAPHVVGELYIGGNALARGYLGRAVATSERFVADPYGDPGARMYRTGDLVRWTRDGRLDFAGRADDQVKIRGFRIELGEITAVLARHDAVAQAAVDVHERAPGDRRIVAYVVPAGDDAGEFDVARLRAHVGEQLPDYMIPAAFVTLDELPMTVHGKLDRRALPVPGDDAWPARAAGRPPRDALEATLCDVLAETLGLADAAGIDDDFFELGGHSLLLVRLRSRIADATGHDVRVATLFQYPTVAGLAAQLRDGPEPPEPAPLRPTPSPAASGGR